MDANSANLNLAIGRAFRDADDVLIKLATRFDEDYENMRGDQGGQQTIDDLHALVSKGIGALCQRAGIPPAQLIGIARHEVVKNWLEEVTLKKLLFTLLIIGKGAEVYTMRAAIV